MTTFPFTPSSVAPFSFSPTLDGDTYNCTVIWNLFRSSNNQNGGWYLNVFSSGGALIVSRALTGSPTGIALESLTWADGTATAETAAPHGYNVGSVVALTVSGCAPDAYNGLVNALITGPDTFSYPISADPGPCTTLGMVAYNINLIGGIPDKNGNYFTSTLVFRQQSQQFEINS